MCACLTTLLRQVRIYLCHLASWLEWRFTVSLAACRLTQIACDVSSQVSRYRTYKPQIRQHITYIPCARTQHTHIHAHARAHITHTHADARALTITHARAITCARTHITYMLVCAHTQCKQTYMFWHAYSCVCVCVCVTRKWLCR